MYEAETIGLWIRSILLFFLGLIVTIGLVLNYSVFGLVIAVIIDFFAIKNAAMLIDRYYRKKNESMQRERY